MTEEEKKPLTGAARVFGNWFVKYTVLLVAILFSGYALAQTLHWDKTPVQPPNTEAAVYGSVYRPPTSAPPAPDTETETTPAPPARVLSRPVPQGPEAPVIYNLPINQRAVYITIDDGWYPSQGVLALMRQYHLPVTAFLIQQAAAEHPAYWREFLKDGGQIEDHTYSHPVLTHISEGQDLTQIEDPVKYFQSLGASADELRPPYGDYDTVVQKVAAKAGIRYVVMWDAVMSGGKLATWGGRPLAPGDIVLLHWVPGLDGNLTTLIHILQQQKLGVASLGDALDGRPVRVISLNEKTGVKAQPPTPSIPGTVYGGGRTPSKPAPKTTPTGTSASVYTSVYLQPKTAPKPAPKR